MTGRRLARRPLAWGVISRIERPEGVVLALVMAGVAAAGWYGGSTFWLIVAVAGQLVLGGLGAVWVIGPATARLGFARYATLAAAGVSITLFGHLVTPNIGLFMAPITAVLLWAVLWLEVHANRTGSGGLGLELTMIGMAFAAAAGLLSLTSRSAWELGIGLTLAVIAVPAMRTAEARGRYGVHAVGQALLHLLAVAQVALVVSLLALPGIVAAALIALAFHAWGGAAEALEDGSSARAVAVEFGALAVLGVVVALLLTGS